MPSLPPVHNPPSRQAQNREYDQRRGSARQRGYTARWDREAKAFLDTHPVCIGCKAIGDLSPATCVDHIVPHQGDTTIFWDRTNWQPSCSWHHDKVKQRMEQMLAHGEASTADMRLNSSLAMSLTHSLRSHRFTHRGI